MRKRFRQPIATDQQADRLADAIKMRLPDGPMLVIVQPLQPLKSHSQNALLHKLIDELASHIGYSPSELKEWLKLEWGAKIEVAGKMVPKSVSDYTRADCSELIEHVYRIAAENGWILESYEAR